MSKKAYFKRDSDGIAELLRSSGVDEMLTQYANRVKNNAGDGYSYDIEMHGKVRHYAIVKTDTKRAYWQNMKQNTLLKALGR